MQFQGLKCLAMYQICHTGAKLSFMGNEFAQFIEWRFSEPLEWFLLDYDRHRTHLEFIRELNQTYLKEAPLWKDNFGWDGFAWIDADNGEQSVVSFYRTDTETGKHIICILNLCPCDYPVYEIGVPDHGYYEEILNSDDVRFGGEGRVNADRMKTTPSEKHGCAQSLSFHLPPLSGLLLKCTRKLKRPEPKPEKSSAAKKDARTEKAKTEKQKRKN